MLRASISFFVLALIAYVFGAYGIAGISIEIGKILLGVFIALGVISLLVSFATGKNPRPLA